MNYSASIPKSVHDEALRILLRDDGQEDLCFALWYHSKGVKRTTALVKVIVPPQENERILEGNASFLSSYFERALRIALKARSGLAFMHSHLGPGWQGMSPEDTAAEKQMAAAILSATGFPLVGLTLGTDGSWSARFWIKERPGKYSRKWCQSVRVVGDWLEITYPSEDSNNHKFKEETTNPWSKEVQNKLSRLRVGIIGAGSVGSAVAESLSRIGVSWILLMDYDLLEGKNLSRTLHSYSKDVNSPKVTSLARAIRKSSILTTRSFQPNQLSICEEEGFRRALDCDVLFSCVDRPWPRSVLNFIALAHLIPVIDGGLAIEKQDSTGGILRADWRAFTVTPTRRCMECLGQYDPGEVQADREGLFEDPGYIRNLPYDHWARRNENVFPFASSVSSLEVLQFISLIVPMPGRRNPGSQMYHFVPAILDKELRGCKPTCFPHTLIAKGDCTGLTLTAKHPAAEEKRRQARSQHLGK